MSKFYVTTPIYYINDKPHIGHAYTTIAADALARFHRLHGDEVLFTTGVDENSQKTTQAATAAGQDLNKYIDEMAGIWQKTWQGLEISPDQFIRTTAPEHKRAVYDFIGRVEKRGDIYKGTYEGLYCVGHEAFMREEDLVDGKCPDHGKAPEKLKEENYFFKLSKYQQPLLDHIKANKSFIQPEARRNEVVAFIERGLEDFSISRPKKVWGIPWPKDPEQVVYVWFDALINYLTATNYPAAGFDKWWPADVHIVGKDIIKFHCIYWPAMLMSAGLKLPERVVAHGFFTIEGQKISKSLGNAIDPLQLAGEYGVDALRYFLLREIPFGADGEFTHERFVNVYNADLANELGNLVQRVVVMVAKYQRGEVGPEPEHSHDHHAYYDAMGELRFDRALEEVWAMVKGLNQLIDEEKPWELIKSDEQHLQELLAHLAADLLLVAQLLLPFLPTTAAKITQTFAGQRVHSEVGILFPKREGAERNS